MRVQSELWTKGKVTSRGFKNTVTCSLVIDEDKMSNGVAC